MSANIRLTIGGWVLWFAACSTPADYGDERVAMLEGEIADLQARVVELENAPGVPGPAGPQGPEGPVGPAGATGTAGVAGPTGPEGPPGATGATGPQGPIGLMGATGLAGPAGTTGATGPQGPLGLTGTTGLAGPAGTTGAAGPQGPIGLMGATGPAGPPGATGPQGPAGVVSASLLYARRAEPYQLVLNPILDRVQTVACDSGDIAISCSGYPSSDLVGDYIYPPGIQLRGFTRFSNGCTCSLHMAEETGVPRYSQCAVVCIDL